MKVIPILAIILCTSLRNSFFQGNIPRYLKASLVRQANVTFSS